MDRPYTDAGLPIPASFGLATSRNCQAEVQVMPLPCNGPWRRLADLAIAFQKAENSCHLRPRANPIAKALLLSGRDATDLLSSRNIRISESWVGTILAGRYRISKTIDSGGFKGHDLALDQTVMVRGPFLTTPEDDVDIWREKAKRFALVRNPNFLNVIEVVSEKEGDFLISEYPRGKSVAELLRERSRFDVEDVLALMTPLAGALDLATFACSPTLISARSLFTESKHWIVANSEERSLSELVQLCVRLDVVEILTPGRNIASSRLISNDERRGRKSWPVRQAALLTYEFLGGDLNDGIEVKRQFKPINHLSELGNSILYHGLLGSRRYKTSESFIRKLETARESGPKKAKKWSVAVLQAGERSTFNSGTNDVLRTFNRDTKRLVAVVLGVVTFAILAFAVLVPERRLKTIDLTRAPGQASSGQLFHADFPLLLGKEDSEAKTPIHGAVTVGMPRGNAHVSENPPQENIMGMQSIAGPTPTLMVMLNRLNELANGSEWPRARVDSARALRTLNDRKYKSPHRFKEVGVKVRLLALWHQSLRSSSRSWTLFSNLTKGGGKKVGYTAHTNH